MPLLSPILFLYVTYLKRKSVKKQNYNMHEIFENYLNRQIYHAVDENMNVFRIASIQALNHHSGHNPEQHVFQISLILVHHIFSIKIGQLHIQNAISHSCIMTVVIQSTSLNRYLFCDSPISITAKDY
ncbi:hypothetical protein T01_2794 [Trichinella spiralis]|uniref:Uncharacterized protein n=1 Tax=Trichinella spiralis TaxID=6334 RepID=A0A0V1B721_TRISP|nr:hypothetical protein T01_2794 [Trichinella spiralis]